MDDPCTVQKRRRVSPRLIAALGAALGIGGGGYAYYAGAGEGAANAAPSTAVAASPTPSAATSEPVAETPKLDGKSPPRTVTWYADNPQSRARVELACLDDPGHFSSNPDCINAHQAAVTIALRKARARTAPLDPNNPGFWSADPETRRNKLLMCKRNPELANCTAAKRSLQLEAGLVR
jgi:hypothetical protein